MPRDIPVGNGRLLVCFDHEYCIRDVYFPHVGQENHLAGNPCRFGVWVEGRFSWIGSDWQQELRYEEDTLVTRVVLHHQDLGLLLECRDAVDFHENLFLREISLKSLLSTKREIHLFFGHGFSIYGVNVGDTAVYDPDSGGVLHQRIYKRVRAFYNGYPTTPFPPEFWRNSSILSPVSRYPCRRLPGATQPLSPQLSDCCTNSAE